MCYWNKICFKKKIDLLDISRYLDISTTYLIIIIIINILNMCMLLG